MSVSRALWLALWILPSAAGGQTITKLPMLQSFVAFPTTIFIDRKGNVRTVSRLVVLRQS